MGRSKGKHRLDKYYHLAKEQGYRSRAAFKLVQLHRNYGFLSHARAVLDLCAAPGGWLQVARKHMPMAGLLVGVDLAPIRNVPGATTLVEDITTQKCRAAIKRIAKGGLFDVVLHDGAPNVGGAWASEANMQSVLVLESLKLATVFLAPNGTYVTKVFRSSDYTALLYAFNQLFHKVEATKPQASRNTSAEIFVVCQGYKAPNKIDPRLLDHKHLFQDYADKPKAIDVLAPTKQKRHREGYDDGISTTHKPGSVVDFVNSGSPVTMLGEFTQLLFQEPTRKPEVPRAKKAKPDPTEEGDSDEEDTEEDMEEDSSDEDSADEEKEDALLHDPQGESKDADLTLEDVEKAPETDQEIRTLCKDLQVLGKREFKQLLKWRLQVRKRHFAERKRALQDSIDDGNDNDAPEADVEEQDPEEAIMRELTEAKEIAEKKLRQKKKRDAKIKQKEKIKRLLRTTGDAGIEQDVELFNLGTIARKQDLEHLEKDQEELYASDKGQDSETEEEDDTDSESDSEAEEAYQASVEKALDALYERQLEGMDSKSASRRRRRARIGEMELEADVSTGNEDMLPTRSADGMLARASEEEEDDVERNPLLLDMEEDSPKPTAKAVTVNWFSQDVFKDVEPDLEEEGEGMGNGKKARPGSMSMHRDEDDSEEDSSSEEEADPQPGDPSEYQPNLQRDRGDFEVVAQERLRGSDDSSSSDSELGDVEDMDDDTRAEILAYGKKMLRRKDRENIIDASYNRYVFHDQNLPAWFVEDEKKHMQPQKPITKEEYMDAKTQLRAIDSRAIHKVAEAKARKRKRLVRRMDKARKKAGGIAEQEDMPVAAKAREIKKLYAQAKKGVYNKTSNSKKKKGRGSENTSKRPLDRRLLADQRGRGGKKASGGKGGKKGRR